MKKIIRLTESDLTKIVKRVIREQEENSMIANKVEQIIDSPRIESKIENVISDLSPEEIEDLKNTLDSLGINSFSSASDVHNKIENLMPSESGELGEEDYSGVYGKKIPRISPTYGKNNGDEYSGDIKKKLAKILHYIGEGNVKAWAGIPAAIAIGSQIGTVAGGFAISWAITGLFMGIAKLLDKKESYLD